MNAHWLRIVALAGIAFSGSALAQEVGPSTTTEPYVLPAVAGVSTVSILTTGDSVGGYRMVGIPDGLGAWPENRRTFNLVADHELGRTLGAVRAHGSTGAFVSQWVIERSSLKVLSGRDHLKSPNGMFNWNGSTYLPGTAAIERLCSADLAASTAYDLPGLLGTPSRIFLSGEETSPPFSSDHGRVFAHVVDGQDQNKSYELPRLGKISFENAVANPHAQLKTIVMLNDDAGRETNVTAANVCRSAGQTGCTEAPSELYMYVGRKQRHGNQVEQAGLTNGSLYGVRVRLNGGVVTGENPEFVFGQAAPAVTTARFELVSLGDVSGKTGVQIQDESIANQVTQFIRVEDGAWDPRPGKSAGLLLRDHRPDHRQRRHLASVAAVAPALRRHRAAEGGRQNRDAVDQPVLRRSRQHARRRSGLSDVRQPDDRPTRPHRPARRCRRQSTGSAASTCTGSTAANSCRWPSTIRNSSAAPPPPTRTS